MSGVQEHYTLRGSTIRVDQNFSTDIRIPKHEYGNFLFLTRLHEGMGIWFYLHKPK